MLITSLCFVAFVFILLHSLGYRVNRSASLPLLVYQIAPLVQGQEIQRGEHVIIDLSMLSNPVILLGAERGYVSLREPMLKQIGAISGDTVVLADGFLFVSGEAEEKIKMIIASHDASGRELFAWPTPLTLKDGQYWLISDPEKGFDSRYFGPIDRSAFTHRARPVF